MSNSKNTPGYTHSSTPDVYCLMNQTQPVLGQVCLESHGLGQMFGVFFHWFSLKYCWNFVPIFLTELPASSAHMFYGIEIRVYWWALHIFLIYIVPNLSAEGLCLFKDSSCPSLNLLASVFLHNVLSSWCHHLGFHKLFKSKTILVYVNLWYYATTYQIKIIMWVHTNLK